jgi:predicted  nucleic acid-binding Zn-ribbon protein
MDLSMAKVVNGKLQFKNGDIEGDYKNWKAPGEPPAQPQSSAKDQVTVDVLATQVSVTNERIKLLMDAVAKLVEEVSGLREELKRISTAQSSRRRNTIWDM